MRVRFSFFCVSILEPHLSFMPGSLITHSLTIHWTSPWQAQNLACEFQEFYPNGRRQMRANNYKVVQHVPVSSAYNEHTEDDAVGFNWETWSWSTGKKKVLQNKVQYLFLSLFNRSRYNKQCIFKMYDLIFVGVCLYMWVHEMPP